MTTLDPFLFASLPLRVHFGLGALEKVGDVMTDLDVHRALVITGRSVASRTDLVERVAQALGPRYGGCFDRVSAHVPVSNVIEGVAALQRSGADALICIGGGSPENAAEAIALLAAEGGALEDYRVVSDPPNPPRVPQLHRPKLPIIAIPTTLAGAEIAPGFSVLYADPPRKLQFRDPRTRPAVVLIDPSAAAHTEASFFGATGLNALGHCVEGIYAKGHNAVADALYVHAARAFFEYLPSSGDERHSLEIRAQLQLAAFLAALGHLHGRPALNHAISHQFGSRLGLPQGIVHGITLPRTMRFNLDASVGRQAFLAEACGLTPRGLTEYEAAERAIAAVMALLPTMGLPSRLRDLGVTRDVLPRLAEDTMRDLALNYNPRPATAHDVVRILNDSW